MARVDVGERKILYRGRAQPAISLYRLMQERNVIVLLRDCTDPLISFHHVMILGIILVIACNQKDLAVPIFRVDGGGWNPVDDLIDVMGLSKF